MSNYNKYKERKPQDTIFEIQRILNDVGLFTTVKWTDKPVKGVRSNRVDLYPTSLGTNGKGTDELYAAASGYAELMERIQNGLLALRLDSPQVKAAGGYETAPDEKEIPVEELLAQKDVYLEHIFGQLGIEKEEAKKIFLLQSEWHHQSGTPGTILSIPFADPDRERVVWLPYDLVFDYCGSNGMAAGNTMEEALVQGMSELLERYVSRMIIEGKCVPPLIPDEALDSYSFWPLIQELRENGRYDVLVWDCTLGRGLPVAGLCIIDKERSTFACKLGSHPSFAVSIERTLTEVFQNRNLESLTDLCSVGTLEEAQFFHNVANVSKLGTGVFPVSLFTEEPGWQYAPWTEWEGLNNREFLIRMLEKIREEGFSPLIRNVSHLGFPACQVVVPGLSEMYTFTPIQVRSAHTTKANAMALARFPDLTLDEEKRLLRLIRFKEYSVLENGPMFLFFKGIKGERITGERIAAYMALKLGDFKTSLHFFQKVLYITTDPGERLFLNCMLTYIKYKAAGMDNEPIYRLLHCLYRKDAADRVEYETNDLSAMIEKVFPRFRCFDCANCEIAGKECIQPQEDEIFIKIKTAMAKSTVSQEELLEQLKNLK